MSSVQKKPFKMNPVKRYFLTVASIFKSNIRDYGMYIALAVIFLAFTLMSGGIFLKSINFTNLLNQTAYVSVLAVGMVLVIVTRQIDLSVGFLGAYLGAMVVVAVDVKGDSLFVALLTALLLTIVIGIVKGLLVSKVKVPAFVVTLAGMFIFRGMLMNVTTNKTIPASSDFFVKLGKGYLPRVELANGLDLITLLAGVLAIVGLVVFGILGRKKNTKLGIKNSTVAIFITKLVFASLVIFFISYTLSSYRGISYLVLVTAVIVVIYHFFTTKTVLGRRIYAVGGNPEAAQLSGINVDMTLVFVFTSMGVLALISGLMYVSMLQVASPNFGVSWELYAIAAAYIGGTSAAGGVGKVVNAVVGSIVIMSLKNGMALVGLNTNYEYIALGSVLLIAVIFDIYTRNIKAVDYVGVSYAKRQHKAELKKLRAEVVKNKTKYVESKKSGNSTKIVEAEKVLTHSRNEYGKLKFQIKSANAEMYEK